VFGAEEVVSAGVEDNRDIHPTEAQKLGQLFYAAPEIFLR
jgi:hypothetical protein